MDRRIEKTQKALENALFALCSQKTIDKISVSELCNSAGINRTTFYKYYAIPEDVLKQYLEKFLENQIQYFANHDREESKQDFIGHLTQTLVLIQQQRNAFTLALQMDILQEQFMGKFLKVLEPKEKELDKYYFLSGGVSALVVRWIRDGFTETPKEMADIIAKYLLIYTNKKRFTAKP